MVRMHPEGEGFETGEEFEDSDCESNSEQACGSAPKVQDDRKEDVKPESLPLLTVGSFARYACRGWWARVSDFITAGDPYSSICTRTQSNLHP